MSSVGGTGGISVCLSISDDHWLSKPQPHLSVTRILGLTCRGVVCDSGGVDSVRSEGHRFKPPG